MVLQGKYHVSKQHFLPTSRIVGRKCFSSVQDTYLYSWGYGTEGQLGHKSFEISKGLMGETYIQTEPRKLVRSKRFSSIAIGDGFTLGLTHDGELFGWGKNFQKGCDSKEPILITVPFASSGSKVVSISAGAKHACIIDSEGLVYSWGEGGTSGMLSFMGGGGQLGHGVRGAEEKPRYLL